MVEQKSTNLLTKGSFTPLLFHFIMFGAILGSMFNMLGGTLNNDAQRVSNEVNQRNFDKLFAENKRQFDMNFRQQSIANQLEQMRAGGLNPAAANTGVSSSPSPGTSTQLPNISPAVGLGSALSQIGLQSAQIRNIDADTRNKQDENEGIKETNKILSEDYFYKFATREDRIQLATANATIAVANMDILLSTEKEQADAVRKSLIKLSSDIDVNSANINKLNSEEALNIAKAENVKVDTENGRLEYELNGVRLRLLGIDEQRAQWQLSIDKKYADVDKIASYIDILSDVVSRCASLGLLGKSHVPSHKVVTK